MIYFYLLSIDILLPAIPFGVKWKFYLSREIWLRTCTWLLHIDIIWSDIIQKQNDPRSFSFDIFTYCMGLCYDPLPGILSTSLSSKLFISPTINQLLLLYLIYIGVVFMLTERLWWWYWARILNEHEMRFAFAFINLVFDILRITFWKINWAMKMKWVLYHIGKKIRR